ncbi:MAG: hypothetical protein IBX69_05030 [Anaerolineales bacterium]|nr:hypothetical protein [Anaerolineales bacterium]
MFNNSIHVCQCQLCKLGVDHSNKLFHQQMNVLMSRLNEKQQRWFAAIEANRIGYAGPRFLSQITGLDENTIKIGQKELNEEVCNNHNGVESFSVVEHPTIPERV